MQPSPIIDQPIVRPKPDKIAKDETMAQLLTENCEVISGNAPIEEARVIGFGMNDDPRNLDDDTFLLILMLRLMKENELVLTEGHSPDREVDDPLKHLPMRMVIRGWDDMSLYAETGLLVKELKSLLLSWETQDSTAPKQGVNLEDVRRRADDILCRSHALTVRRNESMKRVVMSSLDKHPRIWIKAGTGHFTLDASLDPALQRVPFLFLSTKEAVEMQRMKTRELRKHHPEFDRRLRGY